MLNTSEIETILGTFSHILKGCSMKLLLVILIQSCLKSFWKIGIKLFK